MSKKLCFLLPQLLLLFAFPLLHAQTVDICKAFGGLLNESKNDFSAVKGEAQTDEYGRQIFTSKLNFGNTAKCQVIPDGDHATFMAEWGPFDTKDAAVEKLKQVQLEFKQCSTTLDFVEQKEMLGNLPYFDTKEETTGGFFIYSGKQGIYRNKAAKYIAYQSIPDHAEPMGFHYLSNNSDTSVFSKELNRMLSEAKSGFKNITGTRIEGEYSVDSYRSQFCITGTNCRILNNLTGNVCEALVAEGAADKDADTYTERIATAAASALGKNYVWYKDGKTGAWKFYHLQGMNSASEGDVVVKKEKDTDGGWKILILINQL